MVRKTWLLVAAIAALPTFIVVAVSLSQLPSEVQDRLGHVRSDLDGVKSDLPTYDCCTNPSCNFCALASGICVCDHNIKTEAGVCGECLLGWQAGKGHSTDVAADDVRPIHGEILQTMYDELEAHFSPHVHHDAAAGSR